MPLHVVHLAVKPVREPLEQVSLVLRDLDVCHTNGRKAERRGARRQLAFYFLQVNERRCHRRTNAHQYNDAMALPIALYSTAQVRALDAHAINESGVPGYTLMKRAGEAALRYLRTRWPMAHRIVIVCGSGNNGGDGYVLARFAQAAGLTVTALAAASPEQLRGDARQAYQDFRASEGDVRAFAEEQ